MDIGKALNLMLDFGVKRDIDEEGQEGESSREEGGKRGQEGDFDIGREGHDERNQRHCSSCRTGFSLVLAAAARKGHTDGMDCEPSRPGSSYVLSVAQQRFEWEGVAVA